jgi:hypothetical protein
LASAGTLRLDLQKFELDAMNDAVRPSLIANETARSQTGLSQLIDIPVRCGVGIHAAPD